MKTISPIGVKRQGTLNQIGLKSWAEFGGSSLKAFGGAAFRNVSLVRSLNSRSVAFSN